MKKNQRFLRKRALRFLEVGFFVCICGWVAWVLSKQLGQLQVQQLQFELFHGLGSLLVGVMVSLSTAPIVMAFFKSLGFSLGLRSGILLTSVPRLGRFIPGKVHTAMGFMWMAYRLEKIPASLSASVTLLLFVQTACASTLAAAFLLPFLSLSLVWNLVLAVSGLLGLIFLHPACCLRPVNWLLQRMKRSTIPRGLSYSQALMWGGLAILQRLGMGACFAWFAMALTPQAALWIEILMLSFVLATFLGLAAFFTPAGLGVQEGAMLLLLSPMLPPEMAALLTLGARVFQTLIVLLAAGLGGILWAFKKQDRTKSIDSP